MTATAIDIASVGVEPKVAEAIARAIVSHDSEHLATKADVAALEANTARLEDKIETNNNWMETKLSVALVTMFVQS